MKLIKSNHKYLPIVGGVQGGHMHINASNHASKGIKVAMPLGTDIAALGAKKLSAKRPAIVASTKGLK